MALRGEKFDIDLDDDKGDVQTTVGSQQDQQAGEGLIGDIVERTVAAPAPPTAPMHKSSNSPKGWPEHKKRYNKQDIVAKEKPQVTFEENERMKIDAENRQRIAQMSPEEIEQERSELLASLDPNLVERFLGRSEQKDKNLESAISDSSKDLTTVMSRQASSGSSRRVSFVVPTEEGVPMERRTSATSHSLPGRTASSEALSDYSDSSRPSTNGSRRVSFVEPDDDMEVRPSASRHSISSNTSFVSFGSEEAALVEKINRPRASSSERKVSFAVEAHEVNNEKEVLKEHSASRHSLPTPAGVVSIGDSSSRPPLTPSRTSSSSNRRVSFVEPESDGLERARSTASRHSISSPSPALEPVSGTSEGSIHFPKPAVPELDPASDTFLDDLHTKYFPNLAHDPSKLDWMRNTTLEEPSSYDPSSDSIAPKDVRFDFKGAIIPPSVAQAISTNMGLHHHGDAADSAGYTVSELALLSRSAFPAQKCMAMQTLGRILYRLGIGEFGDVKKGGDGAILVKGLWDEVQQGRVLDTLTQEANRERGHRTAKAVAEEAVWNWQRGGGKGLEREAK